ncbi:MAG: ATP-binding protein [Clostridia bacterium]|nr:ATP-binding protein [Clostridia bacterium]
MIRFIPRKTKVKMEFIRGVTGLDLILGFIFLAIAVLLFASNFAYHIWIAIVWTILAVSMFFKVDEERFYETLVFLMRYSVQKKKFQRDNEDDKKSTIKEIVAFESVEQDKYINFGTYYGEVIEITPILFGLLKEDRQDNVIESFANALRRLTDGQTASIIKLNKAMVLDSYIYNENKKYDLLNDLEYNHQITEKEIDTRAPIFEERVSFMEYMNRQEKIYKDFFYIIVYDKDKETLDTTIDGMITALGNSITTITAKPVTGKALTVFLKANYGKEFDERDLETVALSDYMKWAMPKKIRFNAGRFLIDDAAFRSFVITDYPLEVGNAWGQSFFPLEKTRVVMKISPIPKYNSEKQIDKAIMEMESKLYKVGRESAKIEVQTHIETLRTLLASLKNGNQNLIDVNTYIIAEDSVKKDVRAMLRQEGYKYSELFARQIDGFVGASITRKDVMTKNKRGIPVSTLAACFPFISSSLQDPNGIYIGDNEYPVFVDFFKRDRERVNSNMMVIGKSGSGKSYATKTLLTNFSADNAKIFILDPENEYKGMTKSLGGKFIDVGSSLYGILNPFHVFQSLQEEDDDVKKVEYDKFGNEIEVKQEEKQDDSFNQHLQFLEQFFKVILEGIDSDAFEVLNSAIVETYRRKNINEKTDLSKLNPEDYPIFDDLYNYLKEQVQNAKDDFSLKNARTVETYVKKFATGGRNSNLWNGPTSIETSENFVTFNFQSLVASNNENLTNAQMLLVFKYLNNEVINNKNFNNTFHLNRKIIVAVDEAHIFINPKFPVALDFMAQMAKRIRKYGGMEIVITQNIADFVGSDEIKRQSTAIINACQYSLIMSLAPNDINDLVELYKRSGGINTEEQNAIVTAGVGQAFLITGATSRTMVQITALDYVRNLFNNKM